MTSSRHGSPQEHQPSTTSSGRSTPSGNRIVIPAHPQPAMEPAINRLKIKLKLKPESSSTATMPPPPPPHVVLEYQKNEDMTSDDHDDDEDDDDDDEMEEDDEGQLRDQMEITSPDSQASLASPLAHSNSFEEGKQRSGKRRKSLFGRITGSKRRRQGEDGQRSNLPKSKPLYAFLEQTIAQFIKRDAYGLFLQPVDTTVVTDYLTVVTEPMDFGTMKKKVQHREYRTLDEFRVRFSRFYFALAYESVFSVTSIWSAIMRKSTTHQILFITRMLQKFKNSVSAYSSAMLNILMNLHRSRHPRIFKLPLRLYWMRRIGR